MNRIDKLVTSMHDYMCQCGEECDGWYRDREALLKWIEERYGSTSVLESALNQDRYGDVTRITVVTDEGRVFEKYGAYANGVELHLQDDGRTLKVLPVIPETPVADWSVHESNDYCSGIPKWVRNPFLADVYAEFKDEWICDCRYQGLLDDI